MIGINFVTDGVYPSVVVSTASLASGYMGGTLKSIIPGFEYNALDAIADQNISNSSVSVNPPTLLEQEKIRTQVKDAISALENQQAQNALGPRPIKLYP